MPDEHLLATGQGAKGRGHRDVQVAGRRGKRQSAGADCGLQKEAAGLDNGATPGGSRFGGRQAEALAGAALEATEQDSGSIISTAGVCNSAATASTNAPLPQAPLVEGPALAPSPPPQGPEQAGATCVGPGVGSSLRLRNQDGLSVV